MNDCPICGKMPWTSLYKKDGEIIGCDCCIEELSVDDYPEDEEIYRAEVKDEI